MATATKRASRVFTVSFPEELAKQVERTAKQESRNISELMREAFRTYKVAQLDAELERVRMTLPKTKYTEDDVVRLVKEVRAEIAEERNRLA